MSSDRARAQNYAQAILQAMVERWQETLSQAATALESDSQLSATVQGQGDVDEKLSALTSEIDVEPSTLEANLLKTIIQAGDSQLLSDIALALNEVARGQSGPQKAEIISTIELTAKEREDLQKKLMANYGDNLLFSYRVDESLMGGLRVRIGDRLIDNSMATRLMALRESLNSVAR